MTLACVEDKETCQSILDKQGVNIPFAYGVDAEEMSRALGCYYNAEDKYLEATGFILQPDKTINLGAYSTGPVGRIRADNALSCIRYYQTEDTSHLPGQD